MALFSALVGALPSIALRVLHSLVGSDLWSNVSTYCLHDRCLCFRVSLVSSSFICCSLGEVGSCKRRSSLAFIRFWISAGTGSLPRWCLPEGMWSDAAFRMMALKSFSPFSQSVGRRLLPSLSSISLVYSSQFAFLRLWLVRCGIGFVEDSICILMRIGRWSEPSVVLVCQLEEVMREADANETSGEEGKALLGSLVVESQLRIPKFALLTAFSR